MDSLSSTAAQTRSNIKEAFWKLYKTKQIKKITVTEICNIAGYNRSTFYIYFQNIYDVLDAIEMELISKQEFKEAFLDNLLKHNNLPKTLEGLMSLFEKNDEYFSILLGHSGDPNFRSKLLRHLSPVVYDEASLNMSDSQKYVLEYQNAGIILTISKWYENGKDIPVKNLIKLLISLTCNGTKSVLQNMSLN